MRQCCCPTYPHGKNLSSRNNLRVLILVLVLKPQVPVLVLGPQSPRKLSRILHSANSLVCNVMLFCKSINSVTGTANMHEVMVKNGLLTDIRYYLMHMSVSTSRPKPFFTVTQCWCPQEKSLSSRIFEDQFTSPRTTSPCPRTLSPCSWTSSPWQQHSGMIYLLIQDSLPPSIPLSAVSTQDSPLYIAYHCCLPSDCQRLQFSVIADICTPYKLLYYYYYYYYYCS